MCKWIDLLPTDVYDRLRNCKSVKSDILRLAQTKYTFIHNRNEDYAKEDALVSVLELLDCNSCNFDLTQEEYEDVLSEII